MNPVTAVKSIYNHSEDKNVDRYYLRSPSSYMEIHGLKQTPPTRASQTVVVLQSVSYLRSIDAGSKQTKPSYTTAPNELSPKSRSGQC